MKTKILIFVALLFSATMAFAQTTFHLGTNVQGVVDGKTLTISGTGNMEDYESFTKPEFGNIKKVIIEDGVTSIGDYVFYYCTCLTEITIPNSVTSIGDYAFGYCGGLKAVTIPNSVTIISDWAFASCIDLTIINVAPNNTNYESENGVLFNKGKTELICYPAGKTETTYTIPNSVTSINVNAFGYCGGLKVVTIPNSVTSIGNYAFFNCRGLTGINVDPNNTNYESENGVLFNKGKTELICYPAGKTETTYTIPNLVTSIGFGAFGSSGLTEVTIPNSVTSIGDWAFAYCCVLTEVTIPNSVTSIGKWAFNSCSALTEVTIPNSAKSIWDYAFFGCSGLKSVTIPNSVTSIGEYAFFNCRVLTSVTIPNSVTSIGKWAFGGCSGLTFICYEGSREPTYQSTSFEYVDKTIPVCVPAEYASDIWCGFTNLIKGNCQM